MHTTMFIAKDKVDVPQLTANYKLHERKVKLYMLWNRRCNLKRNDKLNAHLYIKQMQHVHKKFSLQQEYCGSPS